MRGSPVTETCVKRGSSNRGQGPIRFLLLYRGSSPFTHCATSADHSDGGYESDHENSEASRRDMEARRRRSHSSQSWRSKPSHRRGRDRLQQQLVKNKQREGHGTARLLLQCSGGVCREGLFLLPYNELAVAQGPKIYQKNEL